MGVIHSHASTTHVGQGRGDTYHTETKKHKLSHNTGTGARANNIPHQKLGYPIGEPARQSACEARP